MAYQVQVKDQYSIAKLAELLKRSPAQIKAYKRILMEAYQVDVQLVSFKNGSLNTKGLEELQKVKAAFSAGEQHEYCDSVWSENPELKPVGNTEQEGLLSSDVSVTPSEIQVFTGNHRNTLAAPQFPTEFNLGSMRSELAIVDAHDDPLALAEQFINGADSLMNAMAEDEKAMAQKIAQTRQARKAVGRKVDQLKRRNDIYSLRTELLADRQNVETAALNEDFSVLQSMGNAGSGQ